MLMRPVAAIAVTPQPKMMAAQRTPARKPVIRFFIPIPLLSLCHF